MFRKSLIPLLATAALLSGCDSNSTTGRIETGPQSGIDFPVPEKIRMSLAVDFDQVSGIATVNGRVFEMQRSGQSFIATVPDVPTNSTVLLELEFSETFEGQQLRLAATPSPLEFDIGSTDTAVEISEDQFSYSFDDDNDQISNIAERNDGTDPFTPENAGTRIITVEFNLPLRIDEPEITAVTALISEMTRPTTTTGTFVRATGLVSTLNTIDIDILLDQFFEGERVRIAEAVTQVDAGTQNTTVSLNDSNFNFSFDLDNDGILNLDEIQSDTDPFTPN